MITAHVQNFERMKARVLKLLGPQGRAVITRANELSADQFAFMVRAAIPYGEPKHGHLRSTIVKEKRGETGFAVSIGGADFPYPLHLEVGHRAANGRLVPGRAYWFPAKKIIRARAYNRVKRAAREAVKAAGYVVTGAP